MENQPPQLKIKIRDKDLKGAYSNIMQITHTKEEFLLDFFSAFPPEGILVSRVIMSPGHLKRMIKALQQNIENYEGKFGKVVEAEAPDAPLGFHTENK